MSFTSYQVSLCTMRITHVDYPLSQRQPVVTFRTKDYEPKIWFVVGSNDTDAPPSYHRWLFQYHLIIYRIFRNASSCYDMSILPGPSHGDRTALTRFQDFRVALCYRLLSK